MANLLGVFWCIDTRPDDLHSNLSITEAVFHDKLMFVCIKFICSVCQHIQEFSRNITDELIRSILINEVTHSLKQRKARMVGKCVLIMEEKVCGIYVQYKT